MNDLPDPTFRQSLQNTSRKVPPRPPHHRGRFALDAPGKRLRRADDSHSAICATLDGSPHDNQARRGISTPEIRRSSMAPQPLERNPIRVMWQRLRKIDKRSARDGAQRPQWRAAATRRRLVLLALVLGQTLAASWSLARTFPMPELDGLQISIVVTFAILFSWLSFSFWTNVAAFLMLWRNTKMTGECGPNTSEEKPLSARTAILMPICEEDASRCFAGIEVMYRSLSECAEREKFDFYILSDTQNPEHQAEEEIEWNKVCRSVNGQGKIFYRRRRINIKRKSGNIADFLRRWSRNYDFMIVLDADSVMTGEVMVRLARRMQTSPQVGIIQTAPVIVNRDSLFARMQQFASRVYGPLFSASLQFWQFGESYYWGHNAIIRIEPFIKHCSLARLPGQAPLGGEILSHDFVEAALMGRAGYEVCLALDLSGSYEESPPSLLDELKRDRRWCQGNLQHLRLLLAEGLTMGHRAILAMGVMAYGSALFWAGFLILNIFQLVQFSFVEPNYFSVQPSLFPTWPQWHPEWAIALASTTALLLFLPKFLSFLLLASHGELKRFGGAKALGLGILCEILLSTLVAPLRMWFHGKFVLMTLIGRPIKWNAQQRTTNGTTWSEAARVHGGSTLISGLCTAAVYLINLNVFIWLLPIAIPLLLSIPLSVFSSRVSLGQASRRWGLFRIPEESFPVPVLDGLRMVMRERKPPQTHSNEFSSNLSNSDANRASFAPNPSSIA
jgi:membrane glycosyltransferase